MNKKLLLFTTMLAVLTIFIYAAYGTIRDYVLISTLSDEIGIAANKSNANLALDRAMTFDWDRLYIFGPYTQIDDITKKLGHNNNVNFHDIDASDVINLLVFTKNTTVVKSLAFPRKHGDFTGIDSSDGIARENAVFTVVKLSQTFGPEFQLRLILR